MQSSALSRTSSAASISSDDAARRTRKRFTSVQLMMLEQVFHQTSHPTREEREAVAQSAGMEMKSVTIWFQNKRQTERKVALHHATSQPADPYRTAPSSSCPSVLSSPYASSSTSTTVTSNPIRPSHTRTLSMSLSHSATASHPLVHAHTPRRKITPPRQRPSLDRVASRSESRLPPPRTPTKPPDPHASLWDNMPSSPLAPPASPPSRDLVEFMGSTRTLEWACAAARLAGKEGRRRPRAHEQSLHERDGPEDDTEEDDVEAVTPEGSLGAVDGARWQGGGGTPTVRTRPRLPPPAFRPAQPPPFGTGSVRTGGWSGETDISGRGDSKDAPQDEDMMRAALALCGLGRRGG